MVKRNKKENGNHWEKICIVLFCMICTITACYHPMIVLAEEENNVDAACYGVVRVLAVSRTGEIATGSAFGVGTAGQETNTFITNWHVVTNPESGEEYDAIYLLLDDDAIQIKNEIINEESIVPCKVVDKTSGFPDIAIIQTQEPVPGRVALPLMNAKSAKKGQDVYVLGFPGTADNINNGEYLYASVDQVNVTDGKISKFNKVEALENTNVIQHTAHINNGNSGGPLITNDGAVIGINTYTVDFTGIPTNMAEYNLSIFSDYAMEILDRNEIAYDKAGDVEEVTLAGDGGGGRQKSSNIAFVLIIGGALLVMVIAGSLVFILMSKKKKSGEANDGMLPMPDEVVYDNATELVPSPQVVQICPKADRLRIVGVSGIYGGKRYRVQSTLRFGRELDNELSFANSLSAGKISRYHCEVFKNRGELYLRDCGSSNGTFYNQRKLRPSETVCLKPEDTFYLVSEDELFYVDVSTSV